MWEMRLALVLVLLPTMAWASPAPNPHSIAALVVPQDREAEASGLQLTTYMDDALATFDGFQVRRSEELFGLPVDEEVQMAFSRAEKGYQDGKASFDKRNYEDAERKLRTTLKEYERSVAMLKGCGHFCDALAMYSASIYARGDSEEAKLMLLDVLSLSPAYELNTKVYSREFIQFRGTIATSLPAALRGSVLVRTHPSGARVFVDGELKGYTPLTVGPMAMGKHLLRLEHPGYRQRGEVLEVSPEERELRAELVPTPLYRKYAAGMTQMAQEVLKTQIGATTASASRTLALDRVLVGVVKELREGTGTEMVMGLFDVRNGRRLSEKKVVFQGDEYGQLRAEVGRAVTALVNAADIAHEHTADPLMSRHGTEDWMGDDRGGHNVNAEKRGGDPFDVRSGTEDW